jgi:predicted Rossmann fold nucleotide-binding protein DprA/Smf involved in DNA uptake
VLAVPGRVDSEASRGSLELLKQGEAGVATEPADVIQALESVAHHQFRGTHEARYVEPIRHEREAPPTPAPPPVGLNATQARILQAIEGEMTPDELARASGVEAPTLRAELTRLELGGYVRRVGSRIARKPQ